MKNVGYLSRQPSRQEIIQSHGLGINYTPTEAYLDKLNILCDILTTKSIQHGIKILYYKHAYEAFGIID